MTDALERFFAAWSETDAGTRQTALADVLAPDFAYADPRSEGRISDKGALNDYLGAFSVGAPGWSARILHEDSVAGTHRAIVGFGDGGEQVQHGTYFAEFDDGGRIAKLTGFAGLGVRA